MSYRLEEFPAARLSLKSASATLIKLQAALIRPQNSLLFSQPVRPLTCGYIAISEPLRADFKPGTAENTLFLLQRRVRARLAPAPRYNILIPFIFLSFLGANFGRVFRAFARGVELFAGTPVSQPRKVVLCPRYLCRPFSTGQIRGYQVLIASRATNRCYPLDDGDVPPCRTARVRDTARRQRFPGRRSWPECGL